MAWSTTEYRSIPQSPSLGVQSALQATGGMLVPGSLAPIFTLPDADMCMFDLADAISRHNVVLYFYPRNGMPSCTRQAIQYSDNESAFADCDAVMVGVSLDSCQRHAAYRDAHGLAMQLLSDEEAEVCRLYGVFEQLDVGGVPRASVQRASFIIGRDGVIHDVFHDAGAQDHLAAVLQSLKELTRSKHGDRQKYRRHAGLQSP
ncbi:peroxiredoxin [Uliginosibacterium sediminicola]|jgi:peroxiredoxin|uniref:thioredoxin-dependent peroxiredoxin n=1 Tax=Uliginosibacterium sediminicola TaxID=2024550 RepID=A0ABU9YZE0_9RHOO